MDEIDHMIAIIAENEKDERDQAHGQFILDRVADASQRRQEAGKVLLEAIMQAEAAQSEAGKD